MTLAIASVQEELEELRLLYEKSPNVRAAVDSLSAETSFHDCWKVEGIAKSFPALFDFVGGLATVFPDTASVESDFSVLGWEKDTYRSALTDFSLEGLLHARQFHKLCELCDE